MLPPLPDSHLLDILSNVGVLVDRNTGSPSSLLSMIQLNEEAQAAIAKAKEAAESATSVVQGVAGVGGGDVGCGQSPPRSPKRGPSKRAKSCVAPCRSSLRIKNLSYK